MKLNLESAQHSYTVYLLRTHMKQTSEKLYQNTQYSRQLLMETFVVLCFL